jgi:small-conductance mechanosensitive channel
MKVNQAQTQKVNQTNQGMENFLTPPPQTKEKIQTNLAQPPSTQPKETPVPQNQQNLALLELEEKVNELEKSLKSVRELELTAFNQIVYSKKLMFKLLFVKSRIYVIVKNPQVSKSTIVSIAAPRWGGSSLRYMIMNCSLDWCTVVSKSTSKGNILSYKSMSMSDDNEEPDDIFD